MADVTFTPGSVIKGANATEEAGTAGETIAQGEMVYLKSSDNKYWLASTVTSADTSAAAGFAQNACAANQPIDVQNGGDMTCDGLSLALAGSVYILSAAGKIAPHGDLAADDFVTIVGVALSTTSLRIGIHASRVQATA